MNIAEFGKVADLVTRESWERMKNYGRPDKIGKVTPPKDLYGLTFGQLIEAQTLAKDNNVEDLCCLLLGINRKQYNNSPAGEMMAFAYWVARELENIAKMFAKLSVKPTAEQMKAGCEKLQFGLFGTLDWYCLRMGITNHDDAESTKWVRIYQCMKNDKQRAEYEQNLRKIYEQQQKQQQQMRNRRK